jgi:hypothetical protein
MTHDSEKTGTTAVLYHIAGSNTKATFPQHICIVKLRYILKSEHNCSSHECRSRGVLKRITCGAQIATFFYSCFALFTQWKLAICYSLVGRWRKRGIEAPAMNIHRRINGRHFSLSLCFHNKDVSLN